MTVRTKAALWAVSLSLAAVPALGCAGSNAATGGAASAAGETSLEADEPFVCVQVEASRGAEQAGESESLNDSPASDESAAAPSAPRRPDTWAQPEPVTRTTSRSAGARSDYDSALPTLYQEQSGELAALACALDAVDCVSAVRLQEHICELAERICMLDDDDARCREARARCERARGRLRASCPVAPAQSPVTP